MILSGLKRFLKQLQMKNPTGRYSLTHSFCREPGRAPGSAGPSGAALAPRAARQNTRDTDCGTHLQEALVQCLLGDVQHFRVVNAAIVKDLLDHQPEGERGDVQHVEQGGFAGTHFVSSLDKLHIALRRSGKRSEYTPRNSSMSKQWDTNADGGTGGANEHNQHTLDSAPQAEKAPNHISKSTSARRKAARFLHYLQVAHLHVPLTEPTPGNLMENFNCRCTLEPSQTPSFHIPKCNNHTAHTVSWH